MQRVRGPSFLDGRCAAVVLPDGTRVGTLGTVHPEALAAAYHAIPYQSRRRPHAMT